MQPVVTTRDGLSVSGAKEHGKRETASGGGLVSCGRIEKPSKRAG